MALTKNAIKHVPVEPIRISREQWLQHNRDYSIREGNMSLDEHGRYWLTEKGIRVVEKEMGRYELRPAMAVMIEQYVLQKNGIMVE